MRPAPRRWAWVAAPFALVPLALARAQPPDASVPSAARGRFVAIGGALEQEPYACVSCHGLDGAGDAGGAFPRLSRQSESYLEQALHDFASGARPSAIMKAVADSLAGQDRRDVAAYYASTAAASDRDARSRFEEQTLERGRTLATMGDTSAGVPPCVSCHGGAESPAQPIYPYLAGQPAPYLEAWLARFKSGERGGGLAAVMKPIADALSTSDAHASAAYYASLRLGRAERASSADVAEAAPKEPPRGAADYAWPRNVAAAPASRTVGATIEPRPRSDDVVLPAPFAAARR